MVVDHSLSASHVVLGLLSGANTAAAVLEVAPATANQRPADCNDNDKDNDDLSQLAAVQRWAAGLAALGHVEAFVATNVCLPKSLLCEDLIKAEVAIFVGSLRTVIPIIILNLAVLAIFVGRESWRAVAGVHLKTIFVIAGMQRRSVKVSNCRATGQDFIHAT